MKMEDFKLFAKEGGKIYIPNFVVGCCLFGFNDNKLQILLLKWKGFNKWALPGGFIKRNEEADQAAERILRERTGIDGIYLQQYHTFTRLDRFSIDEKSRKGFKETFGIEPLHGHWFDERVIAIGYYGLIEYSRLTNVELDLLTIDSGWFPVDDIPNLLFDHNEVIAGALKALQRDIAHEPVCLKLLPSQFTMLDLQGLYESILGYSLDRGNFRKKMLNTGILKDMGESTTRKAHKTPHMYSFDVRAYKKALQSGITFKLQ